MLKIINIALFYIGWVLCGLYHNFNIALIVLSLALINVLICNYQTKEIFLIFLLAFLGLLNDALAASFEIFEFTYAPSLLNWSNIWLFSLWVIFLTTFNSSLGFMKRYNLAILSICGTIGGTVSYYSALKIGVLNAKDLPRTIIYLIINWAILFPLLYRIYFKLLGTTN